jgi:hypothetical protein
MPDDLRHLNDFVESYAGLEGRELISAAVKHNSHPSAQNPQCCCTWSRKSRPICP